MLQFRYPIKKVSSGWIGNSYFEESAGSCAA